MKNKIFILLLIAFAVAICGCSTGPSVDELQAEITELQEEIADLQEKNASLKDTNSVYEEAINTLQDKLQSNQVIVVREIKDEDFLYLIDNYDSLLSRLDYINGELTSIMSQLEYVETKKDDVHYEIEKLIKEIEKEYDEYGDILSEYL